MARSTYFFFPVHADFDRLFCRMETLRSLARFSRIATARPMPLTMVVRPSPTEVLTTSRTAMGGAKLELRLVFTLHEVSLYIDNV